MELKVSTPVKIFALVAILAGLAGFGAMTFLGGSGSESAAGEVDGVQLDAQGRVIAAPKAAKAVAAKANARTAAPKVALKPPSVAAKAAPSAQKNASAPAAKPKPKPRRAVAPNGLPTPIADALLRNSSVVVALYTPDGKVDPIGFAEARQGAALARAGFVAVNVFDTRVAAPLMTKLGVVLRAPTVLVFKRSGDLATRIDGFADREMVAQAAHNAAA